MFLLRGREHTPRLKTVNRVLARLPAHRTCRGARARRARARRAQGQAAAGTATGRHEACRHAAVPAGRAQPRAGQPRAVWRLWAHTCVQHGLGRTVTCGVSAEVKLKAPFWLSSSEGL